MPEQRIKGSALPLAGHEAPERKRSVGRDVTIHEPQTDVVAAMLASASGGLRVACLVTAAYVAIGVAIWNDTGELPILAFAMVGILIALASVSPCGALGGVVLAVPTAFEIHPLSVGSFSLLEIGILTSAAGLALRTVLSGWTVIRTAIVAVASPIEVVFPALLLLPTGFLAFWTMPETAYRAEALRELRLVIVEPLLLLWCALVVFRERSARTYVWRCVVAVGAVVGAVACLELYTGTGGVIDGAIRRATATYSHPNNLALFLERTLLITLPFGLRLPRSSSLLWVCIAFQAVGVLATFSRGALIAVVIGTVSALLLLRMRRALIWFAGLSLAGALVLVATARERLFDAGGFGSEPTRFAIWRSAFRMALDHPLFGVGPDQFLYQYSRRYIEPAAWLERYTSHPHNLALDVWLRLGVAGLACFTGIAAGLVAWCARWLTSIRADAAAIGGVAALVGGLAHGMIDNGYFLPDLAVLTWLAVAFILTARSDPLTAPK